MDVRLTPEQEILRDSATRLIGEFGPRTTADLGDDQRSTKLDASLQGAGWRELRAASADGRPWSTAVEVALIAEELGRGLADAPFVGPTLAADLRRLLSIEATGDETIALTANLRDLGRTVAIDASRAQLALGVEDEGAGPIRRIVEVPLGAAEVGVDLTRPSRNCEGATTPIGTLSGMERAQWTALGLALTAADLCGSMRGALELGTAYASERRQYGSTIGSFQAVRHLLADGFVAMQGARSITLHAAWAVDALAPEEALASAAAAKAYAARAARRTCEMVVQVHGGIGNTWECLAHVFLRRVLVSTEQFGGVGPNLRRVLRHRGI